MGRLLGWTAAIVLGVPALAIAAVEFAPPEWLAARVAPIASRASGYAVSIGALDLSVLRARPSVRVEDVAIDGVELADLATARRFEAAIDPTALLRGQLLFERIELQGASVELRRDAEGRTTWAAAPRAPEAPPDDEDSSPPRLPLVRELIVDDVTLNVEDAVSGHEGSFRIGSRGSLASEASTLTLDLEGTMNGVETVAGLEARTDGDPLGPGTGVELAFEAGVGDEARASLDGRVGELAALRDVELALSVEAETLDAVGQALRLELPALAPLRLDGTLVREASEFSLRGLDLALGESRLEGDLRLDPSSAPPTLHATLVSERFDLDGLLAAFDDGAAEETAEADASPADDDDALLSAAPLPFALLFDSVQGAVELKIEEFVAEALPLEALDARVELAPTLATLELAEAAVAGGGVVGTVALERLGTPPGATEEAAEKAAEKAAKEVAEEAMEEAAEEESDGPDPAGGEGEAAAGARPDEPPETSGTGETGVSARLEFELSRLQVTRLLRVADLPEEAIAPLGGQIKLWLEGRSLAELAGSADGGLFLLMGGGQLDSLLVELAGVDLFQSLGDLIVPGDESVPIRCGYVDLHSEAGAIRINEFVIDTTDTVFLADGGLDLSNETLDVTLEPHPKDPSLIANRTAVTIGGTLGAPEVGVGAALSARAAAAIALSQLAVPALALLPLIELGGGEDSPYCSGLEGALDE